MSDTEIMPIKAVFEQDTVKQRFRNMLGKKAESFLVSVINVVSNNRMLAEADRDSILFAAATAATLDLPINPNLGFAYIVPYKDRHSGTTKAQFQMGYKGFVQLAQRTGQFETIAAASIYEGQLVSENPLTGYEFDFTKKDSDKVIGYAGYFKLVTGFSKTIYMTVEELSKHGKRYSQSFKKGYGLWEDNFDAMAQKTVLKLLLSKFAPLSVQMQRAVVSDQAVLQDWDGDTLEYPDNDNSKPNVVDVQLSKEQDRVREHIENAKTIEELEEAEAYCSDLKPGNTLRTLYDVKYAELSDGSQTDEKSPPKEDDDPDDLFDEEKDGSKTNQR